MWFPFDTFDNTQVCLKNVVPVKILKLCSGTSNHGREHNYERNVSYYQKESGIFSLWQRTDHSLSFWEACQVDEEIGINERKLLGDKFQFTIKAMPSKTNGCPSCSRWHKLPQKVESFLLVEYLNSCKLVQIPDRISKRFLTYKFSVQCCFPIFLLYAFYFPSPFVSFPPKPLFSISS